MKKLKNLKIHINPLACKNFFLSHPIADLSIFILIAIPVILSEPASGHTWFQAFLAISGLFIFNLIIIIVIICSLVLSDKHKNKLYQQHEAYIKSLIPSYSGYLTKAPFHTDRSDILGGSYISYLYVGDSGKYNHIITFPDSSFKNNKGYYLYHIEYHPHTSDHGGFTNVNGYRTMFNNYRITSSSTPVYTTQDPSPALLSLVTINGHQPITIQIPNLSEDYVNYLKQHFLLSRIEQKQLGLL